MWFFNIYAVFSFTSQERFELPTVRLEGGCSIQLRIALYQYFQDLNSTSQIRTISELVHTYILAH